MVNFWLVVLIIFVQAGTLLPGQQGGERQPSVEVVRRVMTNADQGLDLRLDLVVRDEADRPIPLSRIGLVSFLLHPDEDAVAAETQPMQSNIKIALLLDESGSMIGEEQDVRAAVQNAISSAPDQAEIAVFKFSNTPPNGTVVPDLNFTTDRNAALDFVRTQYNPLKDNQTCLYNAMLGVLGYLDTYAAQDRRAVILFTDGRNEGSLCGDSAPDPIFQRAAPDSGAVTPIYTVGLCQVGLKDGVCPDTQRFDENILRQFAQRTHALAKINNLSGLTGAFADIMQDIKGQVLVETRLAPCTETEVEMLVQVDGLRDPIRRSVPISSSICYTPRATIQFGDVVTANRTSAFPVTITNKSLQTLTAIETSVIGPDNTKVAGESLPITVAPEATVTMTVPVALEGLTRPGQYMLKLYAKAGGLSFLRSPGERIYDNDLYKGENREVLAKKTWTPVLAAIRPAPQIVGVARAPEAMRSLTVTLRLDNIAGVEDLLDQAKYSASVVGGSCKLVTSPLVAAAGQVAAGFVTVRVPFDSNEPLSAQNGACQFVMTLSLPPDSRLPSGQQTYVSDPSNLGEIAAVPTPSFPWLLALALLGALVGIFFLGMLLRARLTERGGGALPAPKPIYNDSTSPPEPVQMRGPRLRLRVIQTVGQPAGEDQLINAFPFAVGRKEGNLLFGDDHQMSRKHIRIDRSGDGYSVTDLHTFNGTSVDGQRLQKGGTHQFKSAVKIQLGTNTVIQLTPEG